MVLVSSGEMQISVDKARLVACLLQRGKWIVQRVVDSTASRQENGGLVATKQCCTQVSNAKNAQTWGIGPYLSIDMGQGPQDVVTKFWICLTQRQGGCGVSANPEFVTRSYRTICEVIEAALTMHLDPDSRWLTLVVNTGLEMPHPSCCWFRCQSRADTCWNK
jgi:hypothetical protein